VQTDGNQTLHNAIWRASAEFRFLRLVLLAVLGALLLTVAAYIKVPFWPVPLTMQTFVVLVVGAAYGARLGAATVTLYLAEGAAGLPVFAGGGGLAYMAGPTGGYLVGFLAAAAVIGWLAERGFDRRWTPRWLPSSSATRSYSCSVSRGSQISWGRTLQSRADCFLFCREKC
jgi:biotin transport system substrate-specific component